MSISNYTGKRSRGDLMKGHRIVRPKRVKCPQHWTIEALREHLQWAVDVELYTIPYYMSAMYSVIDQGDEARRLVRSVVNQEMLHMQCAANIANAYGCDLHILAPQYGGEVPHLDFADNPSRPAEVYSPYSTEIGPMDVKRINTMCIIECPDGATDFVSDPNADEYGSIGQLYKAIREGAEFLRDHIIADNNQVTHFKAFYPDAGELAVTESGAIGLQQVNKLIDLIVDQGEGDEWPDKEGITDCDDAESLADKYEGFQHRQLDPKYQNHVDDIQPYWDHFQKFTYLRKQALPETYPMSFGSPRGRELQGILLSHFGHFLQLMNIVFNPIYQAQLAKDNGVDIETVQYVAGSEFGNTMYKVGAAIAACWENGVSPVFSTPETQEEQ